MSIHASSLLTAELADSVEGLESTQALRAIAEQLRSFAHRHPGLYDSFLPAPTPEQDPEVAAALAQPISVVGSVLAAMGVDPATMIPLIRALRARVHGFVHLELRGGFGLPDDIDDSFATTIDLVIEAIATHSTTRTTRTQNEDSTPPASRSTPRLPTTIDDSARNDSERSWHRRTTCGRRSQTWPHPTR